MDTQIAQIAQQVNHLSRPQGHLPGQPETNPKGHINGMSVIEEGLEESPVMVIQEIVAVPESVGTDEQREEESLRYKREVSYPPEIARPYQPPVPFSQRVACVKLFQLEPKFARFLEVLWRIYDDTPLLKALKKAPSYL